MRRSRWATRPGRFSCTANDMRKRPLCGHCAPALRGFPTNRVAPAASVLGNLHQKKASRCRMPFSDDAMWRKESSGVISFPSVSICAWNKEPLAMRGCELLHSHQRCSNSSGCRTYQPVSSQSASRSSWKRTRCSVGSGPSVIFSGCASPLRKSPMVSSVSQQ